MVKRVVLYILLILLIFLIFFNPIIKADCPPDCPVGDIKPGEFSINLDKDSSSANSVNWNTAPIWEMNANQILKFFDKIPENRFDELDDNELEEALEQKYSIDNMQIDLGNNVNDVEFEQDSFYFDDAKYLGIGTTIINNGRDVRYKQGNLTAKHADSVIKDGSISTNVDDLNAGELFFYLGQADSLITDSIRIKNIKNSTFKIDNQKVEIYSSDEYVINITDKSFANTEFNASEGSKLVITKTIPPNYNITNGSLKVEGENQYGEYTETLTTETNASVYVNPEFGFGCMEMLPLSTYSFISEDEERRDFGVSVPENSSLFKLCTRKDWVEKYDNNCNQCGIIDFIKQNIFLHGYVEYLRNYVKGSIAVPRELRQFHASFPNASVSIDLDNNFIFIPILIVSYKQQSKQISLTEPSTYYQIYEKEVNKSVHRFLKVNYKLGMNISNNLLYTYTTNYSDFDTRIENNILTQKLGTKLRVLTPSHELIRKYIKDEK